MGHVEVDGVRLYYETAGSGPQAVVLSHSFLVDHSQFAGQFEALDDYRVIAYDHRDHGRSDRVGTAYDLDALVRDAEGLIDALEAAPCHFVGLSTGGFVGMRLALRTPQRLRSLTLMDTSAESEPLLKLGKYRALFTLLRLVGTRPLQGRAMREMFSTSFLRDVDRQDEVARWRERIVKNDPAALVRFGNAIFDRDDIVEQLRHLDLPTLVIVGEHDRPQPLPRARTIVDAIPGAELTVIPDAGHLSTIEQPEAVNEVLLPFIRAHS